jgi:hypothetical protein
MLSGEKGYLAGLYLQLFWDTYSTKVADIVRVMNHSVLENNHSTFLLGMNFQIVKGTDYTLPLP